MTPLNSTRYSDSFQQVEFYCFAHRMELTARTMLYDSLLAPLVFMEKGKITKNAGGTRTEKYLQSICERNFLSLWSYPGIFRDQRPNHVGDGKEVCDLVVVFDEHVLIFSDKECAYPQSDDYALAWRRWFKRAIISSAQQAWGAERWLRQHPSRVFLDRECTQRLPVALPTVSRAKFHLIVVAHGVSGTVRAAHPGSSGSLFVDSAVQGFDAHTQPFRIGDLDPDKTFIHVLDEESLQTVMTLRDTITDFVDYLERRERLLRGKPAIWATGEEQLLAIYLQSIGEDGQHDFSLPTSDENGPIDRIALFEGHWEEFEKHPQRLAQIEANRVSYVWDALIETFGAYALRAEQEFSSEGGFNDTEHVLRFLARESRLKRRGLATALVDALNTTPSDKRFLRVVPPAVAGDPHYVLLLFPVPPPDVAITYRQYRERRREYLQACCHVVRLKFPTATDIIGLATESGRPEWRSEDALHFDGRCWSADMERETLELQQELGILTSPQTQRVRFSEYPDARKQQPRTSKVGRNKKCPCGSGKKHKHCCLA
jgi:hypothetical protein